MPRVKFDTNPLASPVLHDIIKSFLVYDAREILSFCSTLPQLKRSRIFLPESPHHFVDTKQEWFAGGMHYPADAVWRFGTASEFPSYYVIHEVKTGKYDIETEMQKHYIHHNHVSLYLWAYKFFHKQNVVPARVYVKQLPLESLRRYISQKTMNLMQAWGT